MALELPKNNTTNTPEIVKKKKGRPPLSVNKDNPIVRLGVVSTPEYENNHLEFVYDTPIYFKYIYQLLKSYTSDNVFIMFSKYRMVIYCGDEKKYNKTKVCIEIDTKQINRYYLKSDLNIGISHESFVEIMNTISKLYKSIRFISRTEETREYLLIAVFDDIDIEKSHRVNLIGDSNIFVNDQSFYNEEAYMLSFTLPWKKFKKILSDLKTGKVKNITMQYAYNDDYFLWEYYLKDNNVKINVDFKCSQIKLKSQLKEDEIFRITVNVTSLKSINNSLPADNITIYIDESRGFLFNIKMFEKKTKNKLPFMEIRSVVEFI